MPFDPSEPFEPIENSPKGGFDPSQPFEKVDSPSALESAGHAAINNFPFGGQLAAGAKSLVNDEGYSKNLKDFNAQTPIDKAAHPLAYGAGAGAGAIAPLFIPGAGEVLKAAPFAANAVIGAADALGNTDLTQDPKGIAKKGIEGSLIGGTIGKLANIGGKAFQSADQVGKSIESNATANVLNANTRSINRLFKGNPEEGMLEVNKKLNKLMPGWLDISDTASSKYEKFSNANEKASQLIGHVIDDTTKKTGGVIPEVDHAIQELKSAASKYNGLTADRNLDASKELSDAAFRLEQLQKSGQMNFKNLYEVKKGIGEAYNSPQIVNPGIDKAYATISDTIDKVLDRATIPQSQYRDDFNKAKELFKLTSELMPSMKRAVAKEVAGTGGGLTNVGLGAAALFGHPLAAGLGYAGKTATKLAAPDLAPNLAYKAINAAKKLPSIPKNSGQAIPQEIIDYINSKRNQTQ